MEMPRAIVEIGMAALPASAPSLFSSPRMAGALNRAVSPEKPPKSQGKNFAKPLQKPPSSTPVNPKNLLPLPAGGAGFPDRPARTRHSDLGIFWATFVLCLALCTCGHCAEPSLAPDAARLARWILAQQCTNSALPSYGGVKASPDPAAIGPDGQPYCGISPYFANLAMRGLLRAHAPGAVRAADLWLRWYLAHLDPPSAPDGVPCDHFCRPDGTSETNCVKSGDPLLCRHNDATDSAAATFFSVLWAAHQAGQPAAPSTPDQKRRVEALAAVLLKLQQPDGLCRAKADYRVKYLEDNSEVFAGLRDLAAWERAAGHDSAHAALYQRAADRVQRGILSELWDPSAQLFRVAKFEDDRRPDTDLDRWYPDTQAQFWPVLFEVVAADAPSTRAVVAAVNARWNGRQKPDWAADPGQVNQGWLEAGVACAMLRSGQVLPVQTFVAAARPLKFRATGFAGPFNVADAAWLLQILTQLSPQSAPQ
jgi:hypothetical protein